MKSKFLLLTALLYSIQIFSQNTQICGKVIDEKNAVSLPGATILLIGQQNTIATQSDFDGNFCFNKLKSGKYQLKCTYVSFKDYVSEQLEIKDGQILNINILLQTQTKDIAEVFVTGQSQNKNETSIVLMQKKSVTLLNGISAENFSKMGDADAASALKRVTGVTIEGGKYVFVRGLSDRYSKIVLNSTEIPGLDPNRNTVQLDLFSTNIIDNIMIQKTYSADLPGAFAGGYVNISTKSFPNRFSLQINSSFSFNKQANLNNNFLTYSTGRLDWLGLDDGTRSIPQQAQNYVPFLYQNNDLLDKISASFNKIMDTKTKNSFLNQNHSISFTNQYKVFAKQLGVIFDLLYSKDFKYYNNGIYSRYQLNEDLINEQSVMHPLVIENEEYGQEEVIYSCLLGLSLKLNNLNKISLNLINNGGALSNTRLRQGSKINDDMFIVEKTLGFQQRIFSTAQLNGFHILNTQKNSKFNWIMSFTNSAINEPDLRFFNYDYDSTGHFSISYSAYPAPARFYRYMNEQNADLKANFIYPNKNHTLKYGLSYTFKNRNSTTRKFDILSQGLPFNGNISDYLSDNNIGQNAQNVPYGVYYQNDSITDQFNSYNACEHLAAAYVLFEQNFGTTLFIQFGVRYEFQNTFIKNLVAQYHPKYISASKTYLYDFLPSVNINYNLTSSSNIRFGASRTLSRPAFREIAPYAYYDFKEGWRIVGNPQLERTLINNLDLRYELYLPNNQIVSVSAFYKYFINSIELVDDPRANNTELHYINIKNSNLWGLEFELRKDLAFLNMKNIFLGGNYSFIHSKVQYVEEFGGSATEVVSRPMYGQSPWVLNLFMSYDNNKADLSSNIALNIDGKKLAVVTKGRTPDVYSMPVPVLNWNISKKIGKILIKASFGNILNSDYKKTYSHQNKEYIFQSYKLGRTYGLSVKYLID